MSRDRAPTGKNLYKLHKEMKSYASTISRLYKNFFNKLYTTYYLFSNRSYGSNTFESENYIAPPRSCFDERGGTSNFCAHAEGIEVTVGVS